MRQVEETPVDLQVEETPVARRSGNYHPSVWDDSYIQNLPTDSLDEACLKRWNVLKEEIRIKLATGMQDNVVDQLEMLDDLRQLGVRYHFQIEIRNVLANLMLSTKKTMQAIHDNLHATALLFRLLREYGFSDSSLSVDELISCIKNKNGSFTANYDEDIKGMLSLYEASYLFKKGEDELDEVVEFAVKRLSDIKKSHLHLNPGLVEEIDHALELPLHWRFSRLHSRWFINAYKGEDNMKPILLEFSKLDFNMVQSIYRKELKEMSRWWKDSGLVCDQLSFARNRMAEHYFGSIGCTPLPHFGMCRIGIAKTICFITLIDDIYDVYGTSDELVLFTKAVEEWKIDEQLPSYMKTCLDVFFSTINQIAGSAYSEKGLDVHPYLKRAWIDICKAFLKEARWYHSGMTPSLQDYLDNAWLSVAGPLLLTTIYCLSPDVTLETLNHYEHYPSSVHLSSTIIRLYDDLATTTDEIKRGDVAKSIQCYMKEDNGSESKARYYIKDLINKKWKELNGENMNPNLKFIQSFKETIFNVLRISQSFYQYGDGHGTSNSVTKKRIFSVLINPIIF